jgi:hypothetical protein
MADQVLEIKLFLEESWLESTNPVAIFLSRTFHFFRSEHRPFILLNNWIIEYFFNLVDNLFELPKSEMRCGHNFKKRLYGSYKLKRMWPYIIGHKLADTVSFDNPLTTVICFAFFRFNNSILSNNYEVLRQIFIAI